MRRGWQSLVAGMAVLGLSACATYDGYGYYDGYDYDGGDYAGYGDDILDPWLTQTDEGREIIAMRFAGASDPDTAHAANVWFRRYADSDNDLRLADPEIRLALVQASRGHWR